MKNKIHMGMMNFMTELLGKKKKFQVIFIKPKWKKNNRKMKQQLKIIGT